MILDFNELVPSQRYFAMVQTIVPRPIAWVLSDNGCEDATALPHTNYNLAPFSFFTGICSDPPIVMISVGKKPAGAEQGQVKDTCKNIKERKNFVVHIASTAQVDAVNLTAKTLQHGDSELQLAGLRTTEFEGFALPRLQDCSVAMGCTLYRLDEIGNTPQALIFGKIEKMFIDDALISHDSERLIVNAKKLSPLSRLGGSDYSGLGEPFQAHRPD